VLCLHISPFLPLHYAGSQVWQQSVASTLDTYLVIEDLSPGCQYQFRVSASNPWGISLPSDPSEFVRLPEYGEFAHRCALRLSLWPLFSPPKNCKDKFKVNLAIASPGKFWLLVVKHNGVEVEHCEIGHSVVIFSVLNEYHKIITVESQNAWVGGDLKGHQSQPPAMGWLPPTSSGCPGPHPTWPSAPQGLSGQPINISSHNF